MTGIHFQHFLVFTLFRKMLHTNPNKQRWDKGWNYSSCLTLKKLFNTTTGFKFQSLPKMGMPLKPLVTQILLTNAKNVEAEAMLDGLPDQLVR